MTEDWKINASCRRYPPDWWFPSPGAIGDEAARAVQICRSCPVIRDCYAYVAERERGKDTHHGIWAGLTARERAHVRKKQKPGRIAKEAP